MTAIYRAPKVPHTKVYYFLCGYWTFDKEEADDQQELYLICHIFKPLYYGITANPRRTICQSTLQDTQMQQAVITTDDPIMVMTEITAASRLSRWTIIRKVKAGTFPAPLRLSEGRIGWKKSTFEEWKNGLTTGAAQ